MCRQLHPLQPAVGPRPIRKEHCHDYDNHGQARQALAELLRAGFQEDQLGLLARGERVPHDDAALITAEKEAAAGAVLGGGIGAIYGLAVMVGLLPGVGHVVAAGALGAILGSAATGGAVAGTVGFLIGLGGPEPLARQYEHDLRAGRILLTVRTEGRYDEAAEILEHFGAFSDQRLATPY
jgi:hypothetical protein